MSCEQSLEDRDCLLILLQAEAVVFLIIFLHKQWLCDVDRTSLSPVAKEPP